MRKKYRLTTTATIEFDQEVWAFCEEEAEELVLNSINEDAFEMERLYNVDIEVEPIESIEVIEDYANHLRFARVGGI